MQESKQPRRGDIVRTGSIPALMYSRFCEGRAKVTLVLTLLCRPSGALVIFNPSSGLRHWLNYVAPSGADACRRFSSHSNAFPKSVSMSLFLVVLVPNLREPSEFAVAILLTCRIADAVESHDLRAGILLCRSLLNRAGNLD